ncbi:GR25 family glycosyltransferase involved in LPS biosynthesis [Paenibacillus shirakamiensis]|uniref:GR25 family glycosyltransferase involved in LPS biosynthesis n=1 Tax=Paenibacillus shirakamiensis TaxID=1265935 RepID=A0ABS4JHA0_9BACL|nr:hypothetical protein [Paenibacillus shirakamiensis]MBP1999934.1 GR25 family glycosyltransferase involved in LPS biosynthesis [Paenibacillus shirakamiensis]
MGELNISISIMTHPMRRRLAKEVAEQLSHETVDIIIDPDPWSGPATLRTSIKAWASIKPDATHHIVLQDDVLLVDQFMDHVRDAVSMSPHTPVAFHTDWMSRNGMVVRLGTWSGARMIDAVPEYTPCLALVMPRHQIEGFLSFVKDWPDPLEADDDVMRKYFAAYQIQLKLTLPNLVEHLRYKSLVGNDSQGKRSSSCFVSTLEPQYFLKPSTCLSGLDDLPYFRRAEITLYSRQKQDSSEYYEQGTAAYEWSKLGLKEFASKYDIDLDHLMEQYNSFLDQQDVDQIHLWLKLLSPRALWGLWISGYILEWSKSLAPLSNIAHQEHVPEQVRDRIRSTLIIGGLFPEMSHLELIEHTSNLMPVVNAGIEAAHKSNAMIPYRGGSESHV